MFVPETHLSGVSGYLPLNTNKLNFWFHAFTTFLLIVYNQPPVHKPLNPLW